MLAMQGAAVTGAWHATFDLRALCASGVENVCRYVYASQAAQAAAMALFVFTPTLNKWCRSGFNAAARSLAGACTRSLRAQLEDLGNTSLTLELSLSTSEHIHVLNYVIRGTKYA